MRSRFPRQEVERLDDDDQQLNRSIRNLIWSAELIRRRRSVDRWRGLAATLPAGHERAERFEADQDRS